MTSTNRIVVCVLCKFWSTFMSDGVCSHCRNKGKANGGKDEVSR